MKFYKSLLPNGILCCGCKRRVITEGVGFVAGLKICGALATATWVEGTFLLRCGGRAKSF
jgi:hypothetical protein